MKKEKTIKEKMLQKHPKIISAMQTLTKTAALILFSFQSKCCDIFI